MTTTMTTPLPPVETAAATTTTLTDDFHRVAIVFFSFIILWVRLSREITGELFAAYRGEPSVYQPIDGCFEYYGLDFLVDDHFGVHLLEVNPSPDFKQTGKRLDFVIRGLLDESIDISIGSADKYTEEERKWKLVYECDERLGGGKDKINMTVS